jgi:hypothetical protein
LLVLRSRFATPLLRLLLLEEAELFLLELLELANLLLLLGTRQVLRRDPGLEFAAKRHVERTRRHRATADWCAAHWESRARHRLERLDDVSQRLGLAIVVRMARVAVAGWRVDVVAWDASGAACVHGPAGGGRPAVAAREAPKGRVHGGRKDARRCVRV